jgi:hypothetical protein
MKINWQVDREDVRKADAFFDLYRNHPFVTDRKKSNVDDEKPSVTRGYFWQVMVSCLLTTQQRSGPESAVARFVYSDPFPLSYKGCIAEKNVAQYCLKVLRGFGGLRFSDKISGQLQANLEILERGGWDEIFEVLDDIPRPQIAGKERFAADFVDDYFHGFGPKQARNLLQWLGLTKYEIPIDGRMVKWLNRYGFPVALSPAAIADRNYYHFVLGGIQEICRSCGIAPCLLHAAVFVSFDEGGRQAESTNLELAHK